MKKTEVKYVDGFVVVIKKKNLAAYKKLAKQAKKAWIKYGALEYKECLGDDLGVKWGLPFPKLTNKKPNELILYSYIGYKSKAHRDRVNKKVMSDPEMKEGCDENNAPFDINKMSYGGFKVIV